MTCYEISQLMTSELIVDYPNNMGEIWPIWWEKKAVSL